MLAFLLFIGVIPTMVLESFAEGLEDYVPYEFASGSGSEMDPYILATSADFKGLAENVANIELYSQGKYFRVWDSNADASVIYLDGDYCIGGMGIYANQYFFGSLDLNGYELSLTAPLFGTLGEGAEIYNGTLNMTDRLSEVLTASAALTLMLFTRVTVWLLVAAARAAFRVA